MGAEFEGNQSMMHIGWMFPYTILNDEYGLISSWMNGGWMWNE